MGSLRVVRIKALADLRRRRLQAFVVTTVLLLATGAATVALDVLLEAQAPFDQAFAAANGAHLVVDYDGSLPRPPSQRLPQPLGSPRAPVPGRSSRPTSPGHPRGKGGSFVIGGGCSPGVRTRAVRRSDHPVGRTLVAATRRGRHLQEPRPHHGCLGRRHDHLRQSADARTKAVRRAGRAGRPGSRRPSRVGRRQPALRTETVVGIASSLPRPTCSAGSSPTTWPPSRPTGPPRSRCSTASTRRRPRPISPPRSTSITSGAARLRHRRERDLPDPARASTGRPTSSSRSSSPSRSSPSRRGFRHRRPGERHRPRRLPRHRDHEGGRLHARPGHGRHPRPGAGPGDDRRRPRSRARDGREPAGHERHRQFLRAAPEFPVSPVVAIVSVAALATAILAAVGPAVRAGRLSVVAAITRGTAPSTRPAGGGLSRLGAGAPAAASPLRLGMAAGLAHPVQAAMTLGALTVGVAALVFAVALDGSLVRIAGQLERDVASPVRIEARRPPAAAAPTRRQRSTARWRPSTRRSIRHGSLRRHRRVNVSVPGLGARSRSSAIAATRAGSATRSSAGAGSAVRARRSPRRTSSPRAGCTSATW